MRRTILSEVDGKHEQRIIVVIKNRGATINRIPQQSSDGGTNEGLPSASATMSGPGGSAPHGQSARAGGAAAENKPGKAGWWVRLRQRETVVDLAIIVGAIATVIGTIVAVCAWTGWTP
jgi:hypothetical protein